jgi:hypothetical protein
MVTNARKYAPATVARWQAQPDSGPSAVLGTRMLAGEWTSARDAEALGVSQSMANQVRATLVAAGYTLETRPRPEGGNGKEHRVKAVPGPKRGARSKAVRAEQAGATHPQLGATLTVRALALDERGGLVVHLSNGHGAAWTAQITGHVAP